MLDTLQLWTSIFDPEWLCKRWNSKLYYQIQISDRPNRFHSHLRDKENYIASTSFTKMVLLIKWPNFSYLSFTIYCTYVGFFMKLSIIAFLWIFVIYECLDNIRLLQTQLKRKRLFWIAVVRSFFPSNTKTFQFRRTT